jgi:hypothetical protein
MTRNESDSQPDASTERSLFGDQLPTKTGFLACDLGVAQVSLAGGRVGHAALLERCTAASVVVDETRVVAGTRHGVLVDGGDGFDRLGESFDVAAVGLGGGPEDILAGGADGRVRAHRPDDGWETVGTVSGASRFDSGVLAAASGVYRVTGGLDPLGLADARDVAAGERLFAATEEGIYRRDDGAWDREHDRPTTAVVADADRAHAIDDRGLLERAGGSWERVETPAAPVDVAYADSPCAVTPDGRVLLGERSDTTLHGWRSSPLGLRGVAEFAVR